MLWYEYPGALARFESKVNRSGGCHEWTASRLPKGYGRFVITKPAIVYTYAHRVALERKLGRALEPGEVARHSCDNPGCVRPDHLLVGSHADNIRDRDERGRTARGSAVGQSRLTEQEAREIYALTRVPGAKVKDIAQRYGVHPESVRKIRDRKTWRHISGETTASTVVSLSA